MENKNELLLLRPRSLSAVVSDGYRLYMGTFRTLFRSSWGVAVVYALAFALFMGNVVNNVIPLCVATYSPSSLHHQPSAFFLHPFTLLYILAVLFLAAQAVRVLREHSATGGVSRPQHWYGRLCLKDFLRVLVVGLWAFVLAVVIDVVLVGIAYAALSLGIVGNLWKSVAFAVLILVLMLAIAAICLPFHYTFMRALIGGEGKVQLAPPVKGYAKGLRHWGLLFATTLVVSIFTGLLTLVCELPAVIMATANTMAYVGLAQGDPLGMPENMVPLTYVVFFIAGFIQAYVHLSTLYPLYYAYGSIEQQEAERLKIED